MIHFLAGIVADATLLQQLQQQPEPGHLLLGLLGLVRPYLLPDLGGVAVLPQ